MELLGTLSNGEKVWTENEYLFYQGPDGAPDDLSAQSIPPQWDRNDYRFSHGGRLYQEAVEMYWRKKDL